MKTNLQSVVWIVVGETGQYSNYTEWNVAGFPSEEMANQFRDLCQVEADKGTAMRWADLKRFRHVYDRQFHANAGAGDAVAYRVEMVEVFSGCPPIKEHGEEESLEQLWRRDV